MNIPAGLEWLMVVFLGLLCGSFATALIWRIPRGVSWVLARNGSEKHVAAARSACPHCHHVLGFFDLIPVFSWVFMRGRCRHCRAPIGWTYPLVECAAMLLSVGVYLVWGYNAHGIVVIATIPFLLALFVIDLRHFILPNQLNVLLVVFGVIYHFFSGGASSALSAIVAGLCWGAGAFIVGALMKLALKKEALGLGDVKFFVVCGVWLPLAMLPAFLMWAGVLGVVFAIIWRAAGRGAVFPFGPALIVAFALCLVIAQIQPNLGAGWRFAHPASQSFGQIID